jgi:hypothetical protein
MAWAVGPAETDTGTLWIAPKHFSARIRISKLSSVNE